MLDIDSIGLFNMERYTVSMPLLPSALPPKGEARRYVVNDFLNLMALPARGTLMHPLFRVTSQSSFFLRKKARTFVLTFEKLAWIRVLPSLSLFFLRADLPIPHRNALTYPRKHQTGARRKHRRSSGSRRQRTHTPLLSRKQRGSHPSSSLS